MSGGRHRITVTADQRCGTCRLPVGTAVIKTSLPCRCDDGDPPYRLCEGGHLVAFYRHCPEPRGPR